MSVQIPPTVPAGWAPSWNEQYQTWFYINTKSKQSQWEVPTSPVVTRPSSPVPDDKLSPLVASATSEIRHISARFENTRIEGSSQQDGAEEQAPEVPAGWVTKWNEQYQTWFYYNMVTKESTWEKPTAPAEGAAAGAPERSEPPTVAVSREPASEPVSRQTQSREEVPVVPDGWSAQWNDMYQAWFYVNTTTQETSWEAPAGTVGRPMTVSPLPPPTPMSALRPIPSPSPLPSAVERTPSQTQTQTQGPSDAPEVPAGWVTRFDENYQTWFFVNTLTGKSSWDRPTAPATGPESTPQVQQQPLQRTSSASSAALRNEPHPNSATSPRDPDLPEGWVKRFNEQYQTWFYVNTATRQSQWEKPMVPTIAVDGARCQESDEEMARRLQAEEDRIAHGASPSLPPRPKPDASLQAVGLHRHASTGGLSTSSHDMPPSYEFAVGHGRSASYNGPNPYHQGQNLHPPGSPSRPSSAHSNSSFQGVYTNKADGSLAPPGKKAKKKRSWMLPAGVAAGGVAGLGVIGAGIYALTGSDIGERLIDKVTGDGDGDDEIVASFIGDVADAVGGE